MSWDILRNNEIECWSFDTINEAIAYQAENIDEAESFTFVRCDEDENILEQHVEFVHPASCAPDYAFGISKQQTGVK